MKQLIADAKAAGLHVEADGDLIRIRQGNVGVTLWPDGSICRSDVPAHAAVAMTVKQVRKLFRLETGSRII